MTSAAAVRKSWDSFCDDLKTLGHTLMEQTDPSSPEAAAEAVHYLTRMLRYGLDYKLDGGNPTRPRLTAMDQVSVGAAIYGDNLDQTYYLANIDPRETYRVVIDVSTVGEVVLAVQGGSHGATKAWGNLSLPDLELSEDGKAEIILSPDHHEGNWIELVPDVSRFMIRIYYFDWSQARPPTVEIECLSTPEPTPPYLPAAEVTKGLAATLPYLEDTVRHMTSFSEPFFAPGPNQFSVATPGPSATIKYGGTKFDLGPEEALVMEFEPPQARYWSATWHHLPWGDSADFMRTLTSLNHTQTWIDPDGKVRIVVAHHDPGVQNWLDTGGRRNGMLVYRWIWSDDNPLPTGRVVSFDQLREALPADTPAFTSEDRRMQLAERRAHLLQRY